MALPCLKGGTECGNNRVKTPIYSAPAVKGLMLYYFANSALIHLNFVQITQCVLLFIINIFDFLVAVLFFLFSIFHFILLRPIVLLSFYHPLYCITQNVLCVFLVGYKTLESQQIITHYEAIWPILCYDIISWSFLETIYCIVILRITLNMLHADHRHFHIFASE